MRLIVGLGNPADEYAATRHNAGVYALERLARQLQAGAGRSVHDGLLQEVRLSEGKLLLFCPQTYMNNSGVAVSSIARYYHIPTDHICLLYDDVYIQPGSIRVRTGGGAGGHNGVLSVLKHLDGDTFHRIRIGVGIYEQHPDKRMHQPALDEYVLQPLPRTERKHMEAVVDSVLPDLVEWARTGVLTERTLHYS
jgi:peptidyl-tRNA hydrolase, PTH1 family